MTREPGDDDQTTTVGTGTLAPAYVIAMKASQRVDRLTMTSLYLKLYARGQHIGNGTGFLIEHNGTRYLVTAGHVLSGRHCETGKPLDKDCAIPDELRIASHLRPGSGADWRFDRATLHDAEGKPLWYEHPLGPHIDVAVLRIDAFPEDVEFHCFDLNLANVDLQPYPAMAVSIIGHPLGLRPTNLFPIWKTGHIASDPDLSYKETLPAFLIDATTREGMSGSPVVARANGGYLNSKGIWVIDHATRFLGIYSGRIPNDSEIGIVWRPSVIADILRGGTRARLRDGTDD